jgi:Stress up-regulated Nod 19/Copper binding proteins, plastocyanin/azurin family
MRFRTGLLAVVLPCLILALAPSAASAQADNAGSCVEVGSQGTKHDYRCRMGPITVGPFQVLVKEAVFGIPKPDVDGHVTSMNVDVVDANGKQVPISRLMLHHIVFLNLGKSVGAKRDPTCGPGFERWDTTSLFPNMAERFYGAGEERAKMELPEGYGYPISKQDTWLMIFMFMNHRSVTDTAYIEYDVTVDTRPDVTPVEPYWFDVGQCGTDPVYNVPGGRPRGSVDKRRKVVVMPKAGRLVAAGGHVHGGGEALALRRPECPNSEIYTSRPIWGGTRHPFYKVRPVLHEPGPIHMTAFHSAAGVPIAAGEKVVLESRYDASLPHTRVMGIMIVYVAPDPSVTVRCGQLPGDFVELRKPRGRAEPPPFTVPIVGRRGGKAVNIDAPPGRRVSLGRGGTIDVGDLFFRRPNVALRAGGTLSWRFRGSNPHNVTLANGPRGFSSPNLSQGRVYSKKLRVPGTYRLFCSLHPVDMTATIKVKGRRK